MDTYEQKLLNSWEAVYKKGQLTFWILLSLKNSPKDMASIKSYIESNTNKTLTADNQSMYRALRRYFEANIVAFDTVPGKSGPEKKIYSLSPTGERLLSSFIKRNIEGVFYEDNVKKIIKESM
jgi:DNA-binding PadR family transcriptional regulator